MNYLLFDGLSQYLLYPLISLELLSTVIEGLITRLLVIEIEITVEWKLQLLLTRTKSVKTPVIHLLLIKLAQHAACGTQDPCIEGVF